MTVCFVSIPIEILRKLVKPWMQENSNATPKKHLPTLCKEGSFPRLLQVAIALDVVFISRSYQLSICHFEKEDEKITASVLIK